MKKIDIYEPYVNFRCQKLRASMRKMAQSDWSRCSPNWLSNLLCVWSNCSEYLLDKLRKMQNRAARVITGRRIYDTPSYEILREFNWKPLADLLGKNKVVFMYTKQKTTNYQQPLNNLFNLK